jgi:hypothetical protein
MKPNKEILTFPSSSRLDRIDIDLGEEWRRVCSFGGGIRSKKWLVDQPASREIERWETDTRRDASGERKRAKSPHHGREGCWP